MGIGFSKLVSDNLSKGKQPIQNSLLNFVARVKTTSIQDVVPSATVMESTDEDIAAISSVVLESCREEKSFPSSVPGKTIKDEERKTERTLCELPSASQIDSTVFNELPDDLKNDIIQEYQRKGIPISGFGAVPHNREMAAGESSITNKAGPSLASPHSSGTSKTDTPVSYEGIDQITDIDASYWSALPDDIKAEIERDIQQRKAESTSPKKEWKSIFKGKRSPVRTASKLGNRKTKPQETLKTKIQPIAIAPAIQLEVLNTSRWK